MELTTTRTQATVVASVLLVAIVALGVKLVFFRPVDEKFFQLDYPRLRSAPLDVFIFRPTQFPGSARSGTIWIQGTNEVDHPESLLGRNATLRETLALLYQCQPSHILLPKDATTNHFDFLVTTKQARERLQQAIKNKFGYTAQRQDREADVLDLRVKLPGAPGIRPSTGTTTEWKFIDEKLYWRHAQVAWLAVMMEELFDKPVVDKTGLSGYHDFEFAWDWRGRHTDADRAALTNSLAALGLKLEPDVESVSMLVVEEAK